MEAEKVAFKAAEFVSCEKDYVGCVCTEWKGFREFFFSCLMMKSTSVCVYHLLEFVKIYIIHAQMKIFKIFFFQNLIIRDNFIIC